jgi:hypothetical protein
MNFHTPSLSHSLIIVIQVSVESSAVAPEGKEQQFPPEKKQPERHTHLQQEDLCVSLSSLSLRD